jgi:ribosomal protein L37E
VPFEVPLQECLRCGHKTGIVQIGFVNAKEPFVCSVCGFDKFKKAKTPQ